MKILLTGGAGFIGSNYARYVLNRHPAYRITNLDKLAYSGNRRNLAGFEHHPRHRFVKGDICDKALVLKLMKNVDAVINFAAETHVDRSIMNAGLNSVGQ